MSTQEEKAARIRAEMQLVGRLSRSGATTAAYACPLCRGEVTVTITCRDAKGRAESTRGKCSTRGCLEWFS